ncbi:MAG TPA: polyphenol oxidase family protein [Thermoanaerobaculia bacterium]|nr:polyphenol oxidase family protein [Thermoanaerobaculia bacterium]
MTGTPRLPSLWPTIEGPFRKHDTAYWRAASGDVRLLFVGRGPTPERIEREEVFRRVAPEAAAAGIAIAWAKQIHSDRALVASPGCSGEGDALVAPRDAGLALTLSTADCVPVLLAGPSHLAAAHAGWRGLANGVLAATVGRLLDPPETLAAWIGPSIGPCCYEVSPEVADEVARGAGVGNVAIARRGPTGKPHLDLFAAAERQLRALGIRRISVLRNCTRCDEGNLHSYRREGKGGGRNLSFVYVQPGG